MTFDELEKAITTRKDSVVGPGASPMAIADAEHALGVTFPGPLREYLRRFGWIELGHMEFFGLGSTAPPHLRLTDLTASERSEAGCHLPQSLIPLLNDGAGNLYCMDVEQGSMRYGNIVLWDHELGPHQEPAIYARTLEDWLYERLVAVEAD